MRVAPLPQEIVRSISLQRIGAAELARVRREPLDAAARQLGGGQPRARVPGQVHQQRVEAVARRGPLVLRDELAVMRRRQHAALGLVDGPGDARLHVGGEHEHLVDVELHVHDPDLDRAQARMRAHVPPQVRVVVDHAGLLHRADHLEVVLVGREARRLARAGHAREDRGARRGEPGRLAAPERRARRQRQEDGQLGQQALHDVHREIGLRHRDVHVHAEHELAARHVLQLLDEPAVAVARRDALVLRARERVRAGAREPHAERLDRRRDAAAHGLEVAAQVVDVAAHDRCDLERALHQLGMGPPVERAVREHVGDLVEAAAELERRRVEEHELLLDAERQRRALAECMLCCARHRVSIAP